MGFYVAAKNCQVQEDTSVGLVQFIPCRLVIGGGVPPFWISPDLIGTPTRGRRRGRVL